MRLNQFRVGSVFASRDNHGVRLRSRVRRSLRRLGVIWPLLDSDVRSAANQLAVRVALDSIRRDASALDDARTRRRLRAMERRLQRALSAHGAQSTWKPIVIKPDFGRIAASQGAFAAAVGARVLAIVVLALVLATATVNRVLAFFPGAERQRDYSRETAELWAVLLALLVFAVFSSRFAGLRSPLLVPARYVVPRWLDRLVTRMQGTRPVGSVTTSGAAAELDDLPESTTLGNWLQWALPTTLLVVSLLVALIPLVAVLRGLAEAIVQSQHSPSQVVGLSLAFVALVCGSIFFAYSVKYYLSTAVITAAAMLGGRRDRAPEGRIRPFINEWFRNVPRFELSQEPFISVHIASYNESRVIERLLEACDSFDYENYEVIWVDDSTEPESMEIVERWRDRPRFKVIHRNSRDGFKGGALSEALKQVDPRTEYVAIFDADAVPFADSLKRLVPHFYEKNRRGRLVRRPDIAAVQSYQWHVLNKSEGWLTEAVRTEYSGSYMIERPFQEVLGSLKMIAGTAYMIRVERLRELGWGRSITEDWELTLRLYARGYKVAYTPYAETPAECVGTFGRLVKQRMRWAEGHSFNVRRRFVEIMRSPHVSPIEKLEFVFYTTYYLQAIFLLIGTVAWLISQFVFHARIPEWTALMGYSLIFTNAFSLPLMNLGGLVLEEAPRKDYGGILGAVLLSYLLVPYQGWAALKGLFEKEEGTWNRTPKTGRVTDTFHHLRKLRQLRRWMLGRWTGNRRSPVPGALSVGVIALKMQRIAWMVVGALTLTFVLLGAASVHAPVASAGSGLYPLTTTDGANGLQGLGPAPGSSPSWVTFGGSRGASSATWATPVQYSNGTVPGGDWNFFLNWGDGTCGGGSNSCTVTISVGYYSGCSATTGSCAGQASLFSFAPYQLTTTGNGNTTLTATEPSFTLANCPCALYVTASNVSLSGNQWKFLYGGGAGSNRNYDTNLSTPTLPVPESTLPFAALALAIPLLVPVVSRRRRLLKWIR